METPDKSPVDLESSSGAVNGTEINRHSSAVSENRSSTSSSSSSDADHGGRSSSLSGNEIVSVLDKRKESSVSECSVEVVDLEAGGVVPEGKVHLAKSKRDCRICHLSFDAANQDSGLHMELGCSCKDDLAAAHKQCAEAWFKIKGNKTCEICGSTARNVAGANEAELLEQWNEATDAAAVAPVPSSAETQSFWRGSRFLNFLLACMVFAFVISWLFHFNVPS